MVRWWLVYQTEIHQPQPAGPSLTSQLKVGKHSSIWAFRADFGKPPPLQLAISKLLRMNFFRPTPTSYLQPIITQIYVWAEQEKYSTLEKSVHCPWLHNTCTHADARTHTSSWEKYFLSKEAKPPQNWAVCRAVIIKACKALDAWETHLWRITSHIGIHIPLIVTISY